MINSSMQSNLSNLVSNGPTDIPGFEKEISKQIASMSQMSESSNDIEELIVAALKRRCNDRRTVLHAHLRLKNGANSEACTMTRNELADLAEMVASKHAADPIFHQLADFYMRIARLHNRIQQVRQPAMNPAMQLAGGYFLECFSVLCIYIRAIRQRILVEESGGYSASQ